tara:strand:- start:1008 stop:2339 length:1332 start_codon:yes stop_codon:yes gene_type:complete
MAENTDQLENGQAVLEYPRGISDVPYASFLKIMKYEYQEALEKVAANQNDALGSFARSGVMSTTVNLVTNTMAGVYNGVDGGDSDSRMNTINDSIENKKENAWWDVFDVFAFDGTNKTEVPGGDNEITLPNGTTTTWNALKNEKDEVLNRRRQGLQASELNVALPEEFQYGYRADWGNEFKMGTMAMAADNFAKFASLGLAGAGLGALYTNSMGQLQQLSGMAGDIPGFNADEYAQNMAQGAQMATNPFGVNGELSMTNIVGLGGMAPNENAIQMFSRMGMREFSFSFSFAARNPDESQEIQTIIEWFKRGMHPGSANGKGSATLLTFPDVFVLQPMFVKTDENVNNDGKIEIKVADEPIQHPFMPKTKICALTDLRVNTTPLGQVNTVFDGSIPLVTVELKFNETTALTRVDFEGARTRVNNQLDKGFVRASNMANHPEIGY